MTQKTAIPFSISGRVIDKKTGKGLAGLVVEAWDKDLFFDDRLGASVTDDSGAFKIAFSGTPFREWVFDVRPDIFFKVFLDKRLVKNTEDSVIYNAGTDLSVSIEVDFRAAEKGLPQVSGRVRLKDGAFLGEGRVRAFDQDFRAEALLGESPIDSQGRYLLSYEIASLARPDKKQPDLIVRAFNAKGEEIAVSPVLHGAGFLAEVDLVVGGGDYQRPSEYERLLDRARAVAKDVPPSRWTAEDLAVLENRAGIPLEKLKFLVQAALFADETKIRPDAFYGFFRGGLSSRWPALVAQPASVLRRALEDVLKQNVVPAGLAASVDDILARMGALSTAFRLENPSQEGRPPLGDLLETAGLKDKELQKKFLDLYTAHTGPRERFWDALRTHPALNDQADDLRFAFELADLTDHHLPLVAELNRRTPSGGFRALKELARLDLSDWRGLVSRTDGVPASVPGATDAEKKENYARRLLHGVEAAFPTRVIAHRLAEGDGPKKSSLTTFFANNEHFDFQSLPVDRYMVLHPHALDGIEDKAGVTQQLKIYQRLTRLTTRYTEIQTFLEDGVHSSLAVARMGEDAFVQKYGKGLGAERANDLYENAAQNAAMAVNLFTTFAPAFNISLAVMPFVLPSEDGLPEWESLFGSLDFCLCEHCRSVLSPAAYLVDILAFLKDRPSTTANKSAKAVLFSRRPDLGQLELTCANTNTLMPYVDLVNEVLEQAVSPVPGVPASHRQSRSTAEVLDANPEHMNAGAYAALRQAVYPWGLPFDLWGEEARVYLTHLGVPRHELMRAFQKKRAADPSEEAIAGDGLGLTESQRKVITGAHADSLSPWKFWGYDPAGTWTADLKNVRTFLDKSGLRFEEFDELLKLSALNPGRQITVASSDPQDPFTCDTAKLEIRFPAGTAPAALDRFHRFVRLQRVLGWTGRELDKALAALRPAAWNGDLIRMVALIQKLKDRFQLPVVHVLAWVARLDTAADVGAAPAFRSFYEELFQNPTVVKLKPGEIDPFALRADRAELHAVGSLAAPHVRAVLAGALNVSGADLALLIDEPGAVTTPGKELNLENLSRLFRTASFAKALNLTVPHFLRLKNVTGVDPFVNGNGPVTPAALERAWALAETADMIRSAGVSPVDLDGLLRAVPDPAAPSAEETQSLLLEDLRTDLQKIAADTALPPHAPDLSVDFTRRAFARLFSEEQVGRAMSLVDGSWTDVQAMNQFIDGYFAPFLNAADAKAKLVGPAPVLAQTPARVLYVLQPLLSYIRRIQSENRVVQKMSEALKLDMATVDGILRHWMASPANPADPSLAVFLAPAFADSDPAVPLTAAAFPVVFKTLTRLQKAAVVLAPLRVRPEEVEYVFRLAPGAGWLDLNALPTQPADPAASFDGWEKLVRLFHWRDSLPGGPSLFEPLDRAVSFQPNGNAALANAAKTAILGFWSRLAGWPLGELESLLGASNDAADTGLLDIRFPVQAGDPNDYKDARTWFRVGDCFAHLKRLGASAVQAKAWSLDVVTEEDARAIKRAAKSKHEDARWLVLAKPLRDPLREKQRRALVDYLVHRPPVGRTWKDVNDLYAYFLIDVEMSPCMRTSRIKQAAAAVQLFVQRCLMNLEPEVLADAQADAKWREWKWMKNYRVWEANRKVFLWPENWIEPDLRDNKSPFFKELENELTQSEITNATAEDAFVNYLEKLDAVARLQICGVYRQRETDAQGNVALDVLHVVARTFGTPKTFFYRKRAEGAPWTAWEKIDLDIEGDNLLPVVWNRRLYLFWPVISDAVEPKSLTMPGSGQVVQEPKKTWKVRMAWSEYKEKKWTAKRLSRESQIMFWLTTLFSAQERLVLSSEMAGDDLVIVLRMYDNFQGQEVWAKSGLFVFPAAGNEPYFSELWEGYNPFDDHVAVGYARGLTPEHSAMRWDRAVEKSGVHGFAMPSAPVDAAGQVTDVYNAVYRPILKKTPGAFQVSFPRQFNEFTGAQAPFFFQDDRRAFLVARSGLFSQNASEDGGDVFRFENFYHPFLGVFVKELRMDGVEGLLQRDLQLAPHAFETVPQPFDFYGAYEPEPAVDAAAYPKEEVDFSPGGAYSLYNWELFFHVPLLIADRLRQNQRFEEAQKWFHAIFDPTDASVSPAPQKYWRTKPFHETTRADYARQQIQNLLQLLAAGQQDPDLVKQVAEWRQNPFNPHLIARLRPAAYQKHVVMRYLDTLIAWGDHLFRQARDPEQINEATQLYILASDILGRRPERLKPRAEPAVQTYNSLEPRLDEFSNALVAVEGYLPFAHGRRPKPWSKKPKPQLTLPSLMYFCIPKNGKLLGYWDTVADRLFKIRHCLNIEGKELKLPLFEPPIDPALLVKAAAGGVDIGSALADMGAPLSPYRFQVMAQKASELCGEVKALGQALLSALEKRDSEGLALVRSGHEIKVLSAVRLVKERQIEESKQNLEGLKKSREALQLRHDFYANVLFLNPSEAAHLALAGSGLVVQNIQTGVDFMGNMISLIPNFKLGAPTSIGVTFGGDNVGQAVKAFSSYLGGMAGILSGTAGLASTMGGHIRRFEDWKLQEKVTAQELAQFDRQIAAAEIRLAVAEKELSNHDLQVQNAKEVEEFMRTKYTNKELYDWMVSQIASVYFQSYQLAYDVAQRAEKGFRYELGLDDSHYIQFGYWDSLKKGLLAGEKLAYDLKRMEASYLDQNRREYELSKTVSLALLDPAALLSLKQTGVCYLSLPETLFDRDHPGHYMRRLKSVGLTVPCVAGPYSGVHATLTLLASRVRKSAAAAGAYARVDDNDPRFFHHLGASQSIVTSGGQNDTGLFDGGLRDERYLPFEGQGADSEWKLELDPASNRFDINTMTDVLLHIKYTARDGGDSLKAAARAALPTQGAALYSLKHEFPDEWHRFMTPADDATSQSLVLDLRGRFPFHPSGATARIAGLEIYMKSKIPPPNNAPEVVFELFEDKDGNPPNLLSTPGPNPQPIPLVSDPNMGNLHRVQLAWAQPKTPAPWLLRAQGNALPAFLARTATVNNVDYKHMDAQKVEDIFLVCRYAPA